MNRLRWLASLPGLAEAIFTQAELPLALLDAEGRILRASAAYGALLQQQPEAALGELPALPASSQARLLAALRGASSTHFETELLANPPIQVNLRLLSLRAGQVSGLLLLTDLRGQIALQNQLAQAQALSDVGRLAGGIAHDFNNLLTAIRGAAADLAQNPAFAGPAQAELALIEDGAARGAALVRQLMEFGQSQLLRPRLLEVNAALRALAGLLGRLLGSGVEIELVLDEPSRFVRVDPVAFDRVLVNLAVNARDAMGGQGRLTITAGRLMTLAPREEGGRSIPPGRYAVIEVRDTGPGIPPEILPHIFTPFFTTKRNQGGEHAKAGGGTGLGLATVHGMIAQSGGYLSVATSPGEGACFRITLPSHRAPAEQPRATDMLALVPRAAPAQPNPETREAEQASPQAEASAPPKKTTASSTAAAPPQPAAIQAVTCGRLLLVEDEAPVRMLAARALRRAGWEVVEADCAEAAIECAASGGASAPAPPGFACVISDVIMPGLDGPGLVRALRARQPALPALLISGYADARQRQALEAEDIGFLAKPFTPAELAQALASHLAASAARSPAAQRLAG